MPASGSKKSGQKSPARERSPTRRVRRVDVRAPGGAYPIWIGAGAVERLPGFLTEGGSPSALCLVTDARVRRHHGRRVEDLLASAGFRVTRVVLPSGEGSKRVEELERIWRAAARAGLDRRSLFVALGGGVVGDITGFAAASLFRGVEFVQVPTTLLAMVDASVGGKTGVNLPEGKNLVGAFHQPRGVIMDLDFLGTLPARERRAGFAEVIKTAAIRDAALFRRLESSREGFLDGASAGLEDVIARCVRAKSSVVEADERESGMRMILNFGHTLAHGIEAAEDYGKLLHGEAVAIGMVFAARLGARLGRTPASVPARLEALIAAYGLPVTLRRASPSRILSAMHRDKKRGPKGLRWVFLERIGRAAVADDVPLEAVEDELGDFLGGTKG